MRTETFKHWNMFNIKLMITLHVKHGLFLLCCQSAFACLTVYFTEIWFIIAFTLCLNTWQTLEYKSKAGISLLRWRAIKGRESNHKPSLTFAIPFWTLRIKKINLDWKICAEWHSVIRGMRMSTYWVWLSCRSKTSVTDVCIQKVN